MPNSQQHGSRHPAIGLRYAMRHVAHVPGYVGLDDFLERGAKRRDQERRQIGNESDRVGQDDFERRNWPAAQRFGSKVQSNMSAKTLAAYSRNRSACPLATRCRSRRGGTLMPRFCPLDQRAVGDLFCGSTGAKLRSLEKSSCSDTVGFISDLPTLLSPAFRATLEESSRPRDPARARRVAWRYRSPIAGMSRPLRRIGH